MKFSVLMSIYYKEEADYFERAMQSIWDEQIVKPDEIILVQDGKLTEELYKNIEKWQKKLGEIFKTIPLEKNVGLGDALNIGIKHCSHELIARMDTDDISLPYRFEKQLKIFNDNDVDICSAWISEFDDDESIILSYRKLPELHEEVVKFAKLRCPINHPSVMYKKSAVECAGGYQKIMWFEDYYLWARMILSGSKFYNIQETLVNMRAGYGQLERRGGLAYAKSEYKLMKKFNDMGFLTYGEFLKNIFIRLIVRILPKNILKQVYKTIRN